MTTAAAPIEAPGAVRAPISLPARALLPPRPLAVGLFVIASAAMALTALRPKNVAPTVPVSADLLSATVVGIRPSETPAIRRLLRWGDVTPSVRRVTTPSSLVYGVFGTIPALRAIRRASR
jgi:hypothetical protein